MNEQYTIEQHVCVSDEKDRRMMLLSARKNDTREQIWAIGNEEYCYISTEDFIRNDIDRDSVLLKEIHYPDETPESVGEWKELVKKLIERTIAAHLELNERMILFPQWVPDFIKADPELYQNLKEADFVIIDEGEIKLAKEVESPEITLT